MIDAPRGARQGIPTGVWALSFVSMLMDISSEMIHALLPVYMVTVLGTSALTVGVIEGITEATASITKVFSGALSDWLGKRKFLAALGDGVAAFTKPIVPLAYDASEIALQQGYSRALYGDIDASAHRDPTSVATRQVRRSRQQAAQMTKVDPSKLF